MVWGDNSYLPPSLAAAAVAVVPSGILSIRIEGNTVVALSRGQAAVAFSVVLLLPPETVDEYLLYCWTCFGGWM